MSTEPTPSRPGGPEWERQVVARAREAMSGRSVLDRGARSDLDRILVRHWPRVFHLIRRIVPNDELAEELTQETLLVALRKLPTFQGSSSFGTWVVGIAKNLAYNIATSADENDSGRFSAIGALNGFPFTTGGAFSDDPSSDRRADYPDGELDGDGNLVALESYRGQFRTPSLRGVAESGPYMHKGEDTTLAAVMEHYNSAEAPVTGVADVEFFALGLTPDEQAALVAFMQALSGDPVGAALVEDTSRTNAAAVNAGLSGYEASRANLPEGHACYQAD